MKEKIYKIATDANGKLVKLPDSLASRIDTTTRNDLKKVVEEFGFTVTYVGETAVQGVPFCQTAEHILFVATGYVRQIR